MSEKQDARPYDGGSLGVERGWRGMKCWGWRRDEEMGHGR